MRVGQALPLSQVPPALPPGPPHSVERVHSLSTIPPPAKRGLQPQQRPRRSRGPAPSCPSATIYQVLHSALR